MQFDNDMKAIQNLMERGVLDDVVVNVLDCNIGITSSNSSHTIMFTFTLIPTEKA